MKRYIQVSISLLVITAGLASGQEYSLEDRLFDAVRWGDLEIVKLLYSQGAAINAKNKDGGTPLHYAAGKGQTEVVNLLKAAGAIQ